MNFIDNWREKSQIRRKESIQRMAESYITLADSESRIYIAYQGNPLILLDENLSAGEVMHKLKEVRDNYIDSKVKDLC